VVKKGVIVLSYENNDNVYYVYEWYNIDNGEVFYVGKGKGRRWKAIAGRNDYFTNYYNKYSCDVRKTRIKLSEEDAYKIEIETIAKYKEKGQCICNFHIGGQGGASNKNAPHETALLKMVNSYVNRSTQLLDKKFNKPIFKLSRRKESSLITAFQENDIYFSDDFREFDRDNRVKICERVEELLEEENYNDFVLGLVEDGAYSSFDDYWEQNS